MTTPPADPWRRSLRDGLRHAEWAQARLIGAVRTAGAAQDRRILAWLSHIASAMTVWRLRVVSEPVPMGILDRVLDLDAAADAHAAETAAWLPLADGEDLDRVVTYRSRIAGEMSRTVGDIIAHLATHGAHHRGQVCARLSEQGASVPILDRIFWDSAQTA